MKTLLSTTLLLLTGAVSLPGQDAPSGTTIGAGSVSLVPGAPDYVIVQQGLHSRTWARVELLTNDLGLVSMQTNSYVELQTGMAYLTNGQYVEAQEIIEGFPGGAVARQGQIEIVFPNDLSAQPVDAQTAAGLFRSSVLCLSYADYALQTNLMIAEIQPCQGQIIAPNQVLYPRAFDNDVNASVRYTYRKSGWEQDILIDDPGSLPTPESMGLDSGSPTLVLQVVTEFLEAPPSARTSQTLTTAEGLALEDQEVDWGPIRLGQGQALLVGQSRKRNPVATVKHWVVTPDNRQFLVEEVPFSQLLREILSRSGGASLDKPARKVRAIASLERLPKLKPTKPNARRMELAIARRPERGLVIDYVTMTSSATNYIFQSDTTYCVSGLVNLSGTTVCEGGTVIKFTNSPTAGISMSGPLQCNGAQYRPVVMTSKYDNTVGETITTGSPTNYNGATYLQDNNNQNNTYQNLRVLYAGTGLSAANFSNGVWHCQFVKCGTAINATSNGPVVLRNVLIAQCTNAVLTTGTLSAEHLTADQCTTLLSGAGSSGSVTNSLITAVSTLGNVSLYNSPQLTSGSGVYQTAGAGSYYLSDGSTNRNAGLTNINPTLASNLALRTTYPPLVTTNGISTAATLLAPQAQRDTDLPDLGYHYDPLDYCVSGVGLTNCTLLLTNGVAVGVFGVQGITLWNGANLTSVGLPLNLNRLVSYQTAQEQPAAWGTTASTMSLVNIPTGLSTPPQAHFRFTDFSFLSRSLSRRYVLENGSGVNMFNLLDFKDTQWRNGYLSVHGAYQSTALLGLTNNLLERSYLDLSMGENNDCCAFGSQVRNNLFWKGTVNLNYYETNAAWQVYDNLFDSVVLSNYVNNAGWCNNSSTNPQQNALGPLMQQPAPQFTAGYNGYNSTTVLSGDSHPKTLTVTDYQAGPLGLYYYPTNGLSGGLTNLFNNGSTWATNMGLFHYTTTTNQVIEGSTKLDIGFHYLALDTNGNPIDTNGDGIPDYLSDSNGNGSVDSGEIGWNLSGDLGLKVLITRPKNNSIVP